MFYRTERLNGSVVLYADGDLLLTHNCTLFFCLLEEYSLAGENTFIVSIDPDALVGAYFLEHLTKYAIQNRYLGGNLCLIVTKKLHQNLTHLLGINILIPTFASIEASQKYLSDKQYPNNYNFKSQSDATILYVDDEIEAQNTFRRVFHASNYTVITTDQPGEAIKIATEQLLTIAVIDIHMPKMNGFTLLRHIKHFNPDLPVIVLTGLNDDLTLMEAIQRGCNGFLEKPFCTQWLKSEIESVLAQSKHGRIPDIQNRNQKHFHSQIKKAFAI